MRWFTFSWPLMAIASALLGWLRWGWESFDRDGFWRPLREPRVAP